MQQSFFNNVIVGPFVPERLFYTPLSGRRGIYRFQSYLFSKSIPYFVAYVPERIRCRQETFTAANRIRITTNPP